MLGLALLPVTTKVETRAKGPAAVEVRLLIFSPSVREHFSRRTALRILPKLGMNVPYYKNKKVTRPFVWEKSGSFNNHENVPKTALF